MRALAPCLAVLAAFALAGCGTSDDQEQARNAAERFYTAVGGHDAARACAQLSQDTLKAINPCSRTVTDTQLHGSRVVSTRVYVTNAIVQFAEGDYVFLGRTPQGWKVDAAGCRFDEGKPQSRPADCEIQG